MTLTGSALEADEAPATPPTASKPLAEAFDKGPIALEARVLRRGPDGKDRSLPLFQAPVLRFQDRVEIALSGEAFDPRVTRSDWTLVVVFLPRTVAPTDRGIAELRLRRKGQAMVAPVFQAPYDAIPMFFLVPDSGGRRKVLADVLAHLEAFRNICLKLSDLAEQRAHADRFLAGLDAIRKDQSPAAYDAAVFNFLKAYGGQVSQDLQVFLSRNSASNLDKFQFLTQEFRRTNLLVPASDAGDRSSTVQGQSLSGPVRPSSAYISIVFDLVQIFQNLWPGHRFQYVPALAKDFDGARAQLWYGDWIHTTGDILGALVFSPCRWEDAEPPAFTVEMTPGSTLLQPYGQLLVHPKAKGNLPFALFGHDWRLVLEAPGGEHLEPLPLTASPEKRAFMIAPGPAQEALRHRGLRQVKAHLEGTWGFEAVATEARSLSAGLDPGWRPTAEERGRFMVGEDCTLRFPAPWAACLARVVFRPGHGPVTALEAAWKVLPDGARLATFHPPAGTAGLGFLDLTLDGDDRPALSLPLVLLPPLPVVDRVEAHQGEATVLISGRNLGEVARCVLGGLTLERGKETREGWAFSAKGPLSGIAGTTLQGELQLADGRSLALKEVRLLPPRPVPAGIQVMAERPSSGLPLTSDPPAISAASSVMVSILSARKGAYPFGRSPRLSLRIADDPDTVRVLPPAALRMVGRGQRLIASFRMTELFGASASGRLEAQVADATAGASAWLPLPPVFLDLPLIQRADPEEEGLRLDGLSLEAIESTATDPAGPWQPFTFELKAGHEAGLAPKPGPGGGLYFRLFGWPDLVLRLQTPGRAPVPVAAGTAKDGGRPPMPPGSPGKAMK